MKHKQYLITYICLILLILTNCTNSTTEQELGTINITTSTENYQGSVKTSIDIYEYSDSILVLKQADLLKLKHYKKHNFDNSEAGIYKLDSLDEGVYTISIDTYVPTNPYLDELILSANLHKIEFKTVLLVKVVIISSDPNEIHIDVKRRTYERFEKPQIIQFTK